MNSSNTDNLRRIIRRHLTAANARKPDLEVVLCWEHDILQRLDPIFPTALDAAFTAAREEAALRRSQGRFGVLALDDVLRNYTRQPKETEKPLPDPRCPWDCRGGQVQIQDPEGYDCTVPCSCRLGTWARETLVIFQGRRNVEELIRSGWPTPSRPRKLSREDLVWCSTRASMVGVPAALEEYRQHSRQHAPLPELPEDMIARTVASIDGAAAQNDKSPRRGGLVPGEGA